MYLVTLTGTNPVSTETIAMNFTVDAPIVGATVTLTPNKVEFLRMDTITVTADMTEGRLHVDDMIIVKLMLWVQYQPLNILLT